MNNSSHKANINCIIKTNDDCVISGSVDTKIKNGNMIKIIIVYIVFSNNL